MKGDWVCGYKLLRVLGTRALPSYAALDPKPRRPDVLSVPGAAKPVVDALCVVEQLVRAPEVTAEGAAEFLRDAKRLAQIHHPSLVRVRDVVVGTNTVLLVTDWLDGELLSDMERLAAEKNVQVPLAASLRIIVDVLEGLSAMHDLLDAKREPVRLVHAEVAPRNVVVGLDGRSVLVHPLRGPGASAKATKGATKHPPEVVGYLAPEVLLGDQTADQRADVYGAGVLLWEALMGRRMHAEGEDAGEIVMRLLGAKIDPPCAPVDASWASTIAEVAKRAIAPDPSVRFASASEMLAELRRVAGMRLAQRSTIASIVESVAGERVRARVTELATSGRPPAAPTRSPDETQPAPVSRETGPRDAERETPVAPSMEPRPSSPSHPDHHAAPPESVELRPSIPVSVSEPAPSDRVSLEPAEVVEVIEMEVALDRPARAHNPPPLPPRARVESSLAPSFEKPTADSRTDMASLADLTTSSGAPDGRARMRWVIAAASAAAAVLIVWLFAKAVGPHDEPREASPAATVIEPAPVVVTATTSAPVVTATAPSAAPSTLAPDEPSPFEPDERRAPTKAAPTAAAAPVPAPVPTPNATATPPTISTAAAPPTASAPHPKKRVYDPQGI